MTDVLLAGKTEYEGITLAENICRSRLRAEKLQWISNILLGTGFALAGVVLNDTLSKRGISLIPSRTIPAALSIFGVAGVLIPLTELTRRRSERRWGYQNDDRFAGVKRWFDQTFAPKAYKPLQWMNGLVMGVLLFEAAPTRFTSLLGAKSYTAIGGILTAAVLAVRGSLSGYKKRHSNLVETRNDLAGLWDKRSQSKGEKGPVDLEKLTGSKLSSSDLRSVWRGEVALEKVLKNPSASSDAP